MSVSDWVMTTVLAPLLIAGCWYVVLRVWRMKLDVTDAVSWYAGAGRGAQGYHAFLGPGVITMTLIWIGVLATMIRDSVGSPPAWLGPAIGVCFVTGLAFMLLGFWMWVFRWPRSLVPPHVRRSVDANVRSRESSVRRRLL